MTKLTSSIEHETAESERRRAIIVQLFAREVRLWRKGDRHHHSISWERA